MTEQHLPPGFGPALGSARVVPESRRLVAMLAIIAVSVAFAAYSRFRGLEWSWSIGNAVVLYAMLFLANFQVSMRAGDGWFARNNDFVRTDNLTKLRARVIFSGIYIRMHDAQGGETDGPLSLLTDDPKIWELVLAGVHASIARGLVVDDNLTARVFGVAKHPRVKCTSAPVTQMPEA